MPGLKRGYCALWWRFISSQTYSFVVYILLLGIVLGIPVLNKLDVQLTRAIFYRSASVAYPKSHDARVVVVLASDPSLGEKYTFPLKYAFHAEVINQLAKYQPRAVFIDLLFPDERSDETLPQFTEALRKLHSAGTLIYQGVNEISERHPKPMREAIQLLADEGVITPVRINFQRDKQFSLYKLEVDKNGVFPFAVQAYKDLCARKLIDGCRQVLLSGFLDVWWGAPPSERNCRYVGAPDLCERISSNAFVRAAMLSVDAMLGTGFETDPIRVYYHPTVEAIDLINDAVFPSVRESLKHSVVVYGADFLGASDRVYSEVYGVSDDDRRVPGAFFHAMAIDNLITLKGNVIPGDPKPTWYQRWLSVVIPVSVAFALYTSLQACAAYSMGECRAVPTRLSLLHQGAIVAFCTWWCILGFLWFELSPSGLFLPIGASLSVVLLGKTKLVQTIDRSVRKGLGLPS